VNPRIALPLFAVLALLSGCDDMTVQPKAAAYSADSRLVAPAADTVEWGDAPVTPPPLTMALLQRGQERFRIYCTPCHSELGDGHGMIVQRGFSAPPSYHIDRLRQAPTQHFYDVITNGYGAMYSFAGRVAPADRWAIAGYIRALQLSQHPPADVVRQALR
jgi:mono/diheme cytochrome c family protein